MGCGGGGEEEVHMVIKHAYFAVKAESELHTNLNYWILLELFYTQIGFGFHRNYFVVVVDKLLTNFLYLMCCDYSLQ